MFGFRRIVIAVNERGMLLRDCNFERILLPGVYSYYDLRRRVEIEVYDLAEPRFDSELEDYLVEERADVVAKYFETVETGDYEVALVYRRDRLVDLLAPNQRRLYWKAFSGLRVELRAIRDDFAIDADKVGALVRARAGDMPAALFDAIYAAEVADTAIGLLIVDGKLAETLQPGLYAYWKFNRAIEVQQVDLRQQAMEVQGQEILTLDKVSLRVNLSAQYRVVDAVALRNLTADHADLLYRELQFALRQAIGARSLDSLLSNKSELDVEINNRVAARLDGVGLALRSVGIKDIILPGDMKLILNQVVEAEKVAQANVIRRRDDTAATRTLLNTAKLIENNPTLMRLKELEVLESVTGKVDKLTVFGGLEGVLRDTVQMKLET